MKNLKDIITEKLKLDKHIKIDTSQIKEGIFKIEWASFNNILDIFGVSSALKQHLKEQTNDAGDLYWFGVKSTEKYKRNFFRSVAGSLNKREHGYIVDVLDNILRYIDKVGNIRLYSVDLDENYDKSLFILHIDALDPKETVYVVSPDENDIEHAHNIFIEDNWKDNNINLYKLCI